MSCCKDPSGTIACQGMGARSRPRDAGWTGRTGTWHTMDVRVTFCAEAAATWSDPCGNGGAYRWPRTEAGEPVLWTRQLKSYFKTACLAYPNGRSESRRLAALGVARCRGVIDTAVYLLPTPPKSRGEALALHLPERGEVRVVSRRWFEPPSECVPKGTWFDVRVKWYEPVGWGISLEAAIVEWLTLGGRRGILRWQTEGMGRFRWHRLTDAAAADRGGAREG